MADGRKLQRRLASRLSVTGGEALEGQARLFTSDYDMWMAHPYADGEPASGNGDDDAPRVSTDRGRPEADQALI